MAPPDEWLLPDEPDEREQAIRELKRKLAALEAASPDLQLTIGGKNFAGFEVKPREPLSQAEIERKLAAMRKRHPMVQQVVRSEIDELMGLPSFERIRGYNQELRAWFEDYTPYLKARPAICDRKDCTIALDLQLENSGTQAAQDIDIIVTADANGCWRARTPGPSVRMPKAPEPPKNVFEPTLLRPGALAALTKVVPLSEQLAPRTNAIARKLDEGAPQRAEFHVNLVKPQLPVPLPTRYFEFASFDAARSFTICYRLITPSAIVSKEGEIRVRVMNRER